MNKSLFSGVCTALVTPFYNNEVNYPMLEQIIRRQIDAGVDAIVIAGTTGESPTLSDFEKAELFRKAKQYIDNKCIFIAGTGSNSTEHAIKLSKIAADAGADALMVVTPYYNKATEDGIYAHYLAIASAISIPIIVYNVPGRTGVDIPVPVYKRLSQINNIIGVKEASTSITKISKILAECPRLSLWSGNDDMTVPVISLGGKGVISVLSNVYPNETILMTKSALSGNYEVASMLQRKFTTLNELLFCEVNPIPVKFLLREIGYDCGDCRLPLTALSNANKDKIRAYLNRV